MANCLVFAIRYVRLCKKLYNFYLTKKWMIMGIVDKNDYQIIWYLFADLNLVFCPFYMIREVCFQQKYDSWKPQLESWNTNHESLNRTLVSWKKVKYLFVWEVKQPFLVFARPSKSLSYRRLFVSNNSLIKPEGDIYLIL